VIPIKSDAELAAMRESCRIAANVLARMAKLLAPGVNTYDLDQAGKTFIEEYGAASACFNYANGHLRYPAYTCISVNEEIVHGIGSLRRVLHEGDVVTLDVCVMHRGFVGDNARTYTIGAVSEPVAGLLQATEEALRIGINEARAGNRVGFISNSIESFIRPKGYGIVRDFVGHGVGRSMHEEPQIPNFGPRRRGEILRPGMTLAIEPMIALGSARTTMAADGWTALTADGSVSAHFEHTVLVTREAPEILTLPDPELR